MMEDEKEYNLPESLVIAIVNYLATQPYQEVAGLINMIQAKLHKHDTPPVEE